MAEIFYMTEEEKAEAEERLRYLTTTKRQEIIERIQEARSHGDLSENAEYDAARNEQAANEDEIVRLDYQIKNAVIAAKSADNSVVQIGSRVTVYDSELDEEETYTIRGTTSVDPINNVISNASPAGSALLRHKKGDVVTVKAPNGDYTLKILKIE